MSAPCIFRIGGRDGRVVRLGDELGDRLDAYRDTLSERFGCNVSRPFAAGFLLLMSPIESFIEADVDALRGAIRGGLDVAGVESKAA